MTPARMSAIPPAGKGEVLLHGVSNADPSTLWGLLKDRDASRALQSFQGRLPPRYERLLEQYYRNLSRIESGPTGIPTDPAPGIPTDPAPGIPTDPAPTDPAPAPGGER